ncbi:sodium:proton exchanger [uncultured Methylibium sp.]|uniref:sodium:proton exchanger n=1 Tax=uncultured Methylibium sp. TaxID=381093 RepID=UPI0025E54611|nr:sodium:proton exchanger [uncultured Methylibium sp.]
MQRFLAYLALAVAVIVPAVVLRLTGWRPGPVIDTAVFGVAVLAAGFMLSWGAEAAEKRIAQGLILALVALVTVLPEYAVDMYYAYQAGKAPDSNYVHYAAANMTGANRLLVGVAWPLMALLYWARTRNRGIQLAEANLVEIGFLLLASLYAFVIVLTNRISLLDSVVLVAVFGSYLWVAGRMPKADESLAADDEPGPAAALATLPPRRLWAWAGGLAAVAAVVILASAEPFAESLVASGRVLGIDEFLLIQWLAPLASEAPAVVIAVLFVLSGRSEGGLTTMISDKINQWTLLVGMLPLAMSIGAGGITALPLDARQHEEFFLTAAQSLFGVALLLKLRFGVGGALALAALFGVQIALAFVYRDDAPRAIASLTWLAWVYLALALVLFARNGPAAWRSVQKLRGGAVAPAPH